MKEAVVVSAVRTAVGKAPRGMLKDTRPDDVAGKVLQEVVSRTPGLSADAVDDIVLGCAFPESDQGLAQLSDEGVVSDIERPGRAEERHVP